MLLFICVVGVLWWSRYITQAKTPKRYPMAPLVHTAHTVALHRQPPEERISTLQAISRHTKHMLVASHRNAAEVAVRALTLSEHRWPEDPRQRMVLQLALAQSRNGRMPLYRLFPLPESEGVVAVASAPAATVLFKSDEPQWLADYQGQPHITAVLDLHLRALDASQLVLPHKLLTGLPGFGKTLLAKIITHEMQQRAKRLQLPAIGFVETYAANLNSVQAMDTIVRQLQQHPAAVWFIDELHVINELLATKLYLLMEEGRYPFEGSLNPTALPPLMVIGATTDYGMLHPALKRRFGEALMMRPLSRDALQHMASSLLPQATDEARHLLVARCEASGAPHELKTLAKDAQVYAKAHGHVTLDAALMTDVFATWEIDERGLRPIDRRVLETLYRRPKFRAKDGLLLGYGASEADICAMSGLDLGEFRAVIRPRLMSRGYIEVRSGFGLRLTDQALQDYPKAVVCE